MKQRETRRRPILPAIQAVRDRKKRILPAAVNPNRKRRKKSKSVNAESRIRRDARVNAESRVRRDARVSAENQVRRDVRASAESRVRREPEENRVRRGVRGNAENRGRRESQVRRDRRGQPDRPRGEPGPRGPAGPCGYPQNSAFASFFGRDLFLPESASLPLKTDIPDVTQNISLCNDYSVALAPGYYAVYYYLSTEMKRHGFIELTPIFNDCGQTIYASRAETGSRKELLVISRYFIAEIPSASMLFFAWNSSAGVSKINMNVSIEKLGRQ